MTMLEIILSTELGKLLYEKENCFDWIEEERINKKINAIYILLDIDKREEGFADRMRSVYGILIGERAE